MARQKWLAGAGRRVFPVCGRVPKSALQPLMVKKANNFTLNNETMATLLGLVEVPISSQSMARLVLFGDLIMTTWSIISLDQ